MTRWAKAGSSQKHKRMPEDSTPWEELSKNIKRMKKNVKNSQKEDFQACNVKESVDEHQEYENKNTIKDTPILNEPINESKIRKKKKQRNSKKIDFSDKKESNMPEDSPEIESSKNTKTIKSEDFKLSKYEKQKYSKQSESKISSIEEEILFKSTKERKLRKRKSKKNGICGEKIGVCVENENNKGKIPVVDSIPYTEDTKDEINDSTKRESKELKNPKLESGKNLDQLNPSSPDSNLSEENKRAIAESRRLRKKEIFRQKLKEKRKKLGIMLLPKNIEDRLYRIKRRLREKGFPPEKVKEIIREERKKAQNEYRKTIVTKTCFNCRKPGHVLADCPQLSKLDNQETGICFKCGSTEHISAKCKKKVAGFPFASCFICKNQGHISRDCPNNKRGIYPKGGKCNLCDSINHLRKDCPLLKKKSEEETPIQLHTIDEGKSIDDEIMDIQDSKKKQISKKHKIVAF